MVGRWRALKHWFSSASYPSGPSQASCHIYFATPFYEVMPCLSAVHFILSDRFRQFYLQKRMLPAFWNEPPNPFGSCDIKPAPIYVWMAMRSTAEWVFGRPTSCACSTGHACASMFSIYGQGGWHINRTRKRSAELSCSGDISWHDVNHTHEWK